MSSRFNFVIDNPFVKGTFNSAADLYQIDRPVYRSKYKRWSLQITNFNTKNILSLSADWRDRTEDHKGFGLVAQIFNFGFMFEFYDTRHADE